MNDLFTEVLRNANHLILTLKDPETLEKDMFERMRNDENCLSSLLEDVNKATIRYSVSNLVSLEDFLAQYVFEKEEGYLFLEQLLEKAIATNRNKPILFDSKYIFLSEDGRNVYFVVLPILVDQWLEQREDMKEWVKYLSSHLQIQSTFEIPGYLMCFLNSPEFSIPNLILGLKSVHKQYYPTKFTFFKRKKETTFYCREPVHPLYKVEPLPQRIQMEKTAVLGMELRSNAYLLQGSDRYDLIGEEMIIGRSMACDIRINDDSISLQHAKITHQKDAFYIQDLKSTNGTYLEGKKVQRKMRLREGMHIRFSQSTFEFHQ